MTTRRLLAVASAVAALAPLAGCPAPNTAPTVNAGADKSATILSTVTLNGSGADVEGGVTFLWTQVSGLPVGQITNANTPNASFTAPAIPGGLTFRLTVTDSNGVQASDDVVINVTL